LAPLALANLTKDVAIADRVETARSFWQRFRGLMGRAALGRGDGLWLPATSSIHMMFMRFPIDCAFLSREEQGGSRIVVAVRHELPPWRGIVWWVRGADGVVELPAGTLAASGTEIGDRVRFTGS
jgi:uncharacterized membrane protein (UPF0127 family)